MLPRIRTLLLGAGVSGTLAFLAPAAHAIDALILEEIQTAAHNGDAVRAVGFAADGFGGDWVISGGEDAMLRSWTLQLVEERVSTLDHIIYDLEPSVDGSIVATGEGGWNGSTSSDTLRIWDADGFVVGARAPIGFVYVVAISPDKSWTAASGFSGDIAVYETANLELYATKTTNKKRTKAIAFSPDGTVLASTSKGGTIQLWSFPRDQCAPQSCELDLLPVSMSHSGAWDVPIAFWPFSTSAETKIVSGTDSGMVKVWTIGSLSDANPSVSFGSVDSGAVRSLAWSPNGSMIVAGGDGDITVYDSDTLEILFQDVNAHAGRVNDVEFSPGSSMIASGGADGALKLWRFSATSEDPAPPVADGLVGSAMTLTEGEGPEDLEISFDNATCSAVNAMVVYGNIGDYNGYQGAVDSGCNIGSGPDATITHAGSNVWFSVIWVNSLNQPGHPGFSSAGARTWSATGLCGATTDDQSDGTCD